MDAEHVYELLMDDIKTGKIKIIFTDGSSLGNGKDKIKAQGWGDVEEPKGKNGKPMSEAEKSAEESETKVRVLQAAQTAKSRGNLPSAFKGLIDGYLEPKVNWKERIRTFAGGNKPDDYSYRRPNRKHMILSSVYLPTVEYTGSGIIVIGVDSSGSVSDMEIAQFLGEIKSIHSELRPELLVVLWVDTEIHHIAQYFAHDEFDDKTRYACGGTVLRPAFDWVEKEGVIPDSFIYLTDLEIGNDMDDLTPDYPVLWVSTRGDKAPFGEVVKIKIN
jgi:predicted metal-dependent peptidase